MAMMPTSRCCPSPPSANRMHWNRNGARSPPSTFWRARPTRPRAESRGCILPTPPARPSDVPAACKSARRRRRKRRHLQKVQGDAARPSDVPAAAKDALLGSMSAGRVGTKAKHALTHETSTPESIAFLSLPDGGVSNVRLAKPSISASFPDC